MCRFLKIKMRYSQVQLITYSLFFIFISESFADRRLYDEGACASDDFVCNNGQCIKSILQCNNRPDCFDHSDEENCLTTCSSNEYRCLEGICISIDKRCNNYPDCRNGDDEESCDCRPDDFYCEDGNCVSYSSLCNGVQECRDGSDEKDCDFAPCPLTDFTCGDRSCIPKALVCDGIDHCLGAEDELHCDKNCTPTQFKCVSGNECIESVYRCDGYPDCPDNSDEDCYKEGSSGSIINNTSSLPKCEDGEKLCENGVCIRKEFFCDGNSDCLDNSDESNCNYQNNSKLNYSNCKNDQFECLPHVCINRFKMCNGHLDCPNGKDETNCSQHRYLKEENATLNLKVYPSDQIINERSEVVFQCRDEGPLRTKVRWIRGNGEPLPANSLVENGRLEISNIQVEHSGNYVCEAEQYLNLPGSHITAHLTVEKYNHSSFPPSKTCNQFEATCGNEECIPKHYVCNGKLDCSDGSDEIRCGHHGCEPNEFRCVNKQCVSKIWQCDGDKDCTDGSDEENCSVSPYNLPCNYGEFKCSSNNQCIPKSYHCDHENDCLDASDEIGCSPVYIVKPPPPMVILNPGDTLSLTCTAIGIPLPEVNWRLNWGHIPQKCTSISSNGNGTLKCPDVRFEDQGAYSCEGINVMGFVIAVPDTILVVKNTSVCPLGKFNPEAKRSEECISCFCFGATKDCRSANLFTYQILLPMEHYKIVPVEIEPSIKILTDRNFTETIPIENDGVYIRKLNNKINKNTITYFGLPDHFTGNQLKSYGGYLNYHIRFDGYGINNEAPSVIITGNNLSIFYSSHILPNQESEQKIRLLYGEWYKQDYRGSNLASREDIMMVLANINNILIKAQYENSFQLNVSITNVMLDSARSTGLDLVSFVEECHCPPGYSGMSCENCAPGYVKQKSGQWLGQCFRVNKQTSKCPKTYYGDPSRGIPCERCPCPIPSNQFNRTCHLDFDSVNPKCDCPPGYEGKQCERCAEGYHGNPIQGKQCLSYEQCDRSGSLTSEPDPYTQRCQCKEYVTGSKCNQCKVNTFSLASTNQFGCINCFCMGITNNCISSNWYRSEIRVSFTHSVQGFQLIGSNDRDSIPITSGITIKSETREIVFNEFPDRGDVYYWRLPTIFLGNQISSYGGNLKYILRYVPSPGGLTSRNSAADVELISSNDITLLYYSGEFSDPNIAKNSSVPLLEQYWQRSDGTKADREHLLMALADVEAIRIKATYTTHTHEAALSYVSLDIAEEYNTGRPYAIEVEKCKCPIGYQGLSCEDCAAGYTRAIEGLYLGICEPCKCNGHSNQCDSENGACENCADHTTGDHCEICEPGYEGDPSYGTQNDCEIKSGSVAACQCNSIGSETSSCSEGQCECKRNVEGLVCNRCRFSTFGLSQNNPDGCNDCFCSGVTNECHESSLYIQQIPVFLYDNQHGFTLTDSSRREVITENFKLNISINKIGYEYSTDRNKRLFWSLPNIFTGNKIKSYGGNLLLTLHITAPTQSVCHKDQDVILIGNGLTLYWSSLENVTPESTMTYSVPLKETEWRHLLYNGLRTATRFDLMTVLANIDTILVRASYCDEMKATYISDISLDTAVEIFTGNPRATQVETCRCPIGYSGTSCETCAPGYYRNVNDRSTSILGSCNPCPCNKNEQNCELDWSGQVKCNCHSQYTGKFCQDIADIPQLLATISTTTIQSTSISIQIKEPKIQIVKIGDGVRYHCSAKSLDNEPISVKWEKEDGYLSADRSIDDSYGVLFIREVKVSDSGNYICRVTDGVHVKTAKVTLHVGAFSKLTIPVKDSVNKTIININPSHLKVIEGNPAEFLCEVTGLTQYAIKWIRSDKKINPNATQSDGILKIPSVTLYDAGDYKCIVRSDNGYDEKSVQLYVKAVDYNSSYQDNVLVVSPSKWSGFSGDTVRLTCNPSRPVQQIIWSRANRLSLPVAATQNNGVLTIPNSAFNDAGWYICTGILHDGSEQSTTISVTIYPRHDMPVVSIEPQRQKVPQGSMASIRCIVKGDETNIKWRKNRKEILDSNIQMIGSKLHINNVQISNRGIYTCQIKQQENYEAAAIIEVEPREMPVLQILPNESQTVLEGGTADFHCRAIAGIPTPKIKWSRQDGKPVKLNYQIVSNEILRINNVTYSDRGSYVCVAENSVGVTSAIVNLAINSFPIIKISPQNGILQLKSGEKLHLVCTATGYPQPIVSWNKDYNKNSSEQSVINSYNSGPSATIDINSISREDEGTYTCKASNAAGVITDYVQLRINDDINSIDYSEICLGDPICYENPQVKLHEHNSLLVDRSSKIPSGGKVLIRCKLFNTADTNIYLDWKREDGRPMPRGSTISDGTLFIQDVQKEDSGDYTCFGIDAYGRQLFSAKSQLTVFDFPKVELRPTKQTVKPGESPYINCIVTGEKPINVEWEAIGRPLPTTVSQSNGVLQFYSITFSDAGKYVCKAWNELGTAESVAEVTVEASTTPLVRVQASKKPVFAGESIDLHCVTSGIVNPRYVWSKPYESSLPLNAKEYGNILSLIGVDTSNNGVYRCTIDSEDGVIEDDIILEILGNKSVFEEPYQTYVDIKSTPLEKNLELLCRDDLQLPVHYRWTKKNGSLPIKCEINNDKLILIELDEDAAGIYSCMANNGQEIVETFTRVIITGLIPFFSQIPLSFIELPPLINANLQFDIEISFRPINSTGILLYTSETPNGVGDFLLLALENSFPVFKFDLGSGPTIIQANRNITLEDWHTIIIRRNYKEGIMIVDNIYSYQANSRGKKDGLDIPYPLYVGGISNNIVINENAGINIGFIGCINKLVIGGKKINLMSNMLISQSIATCKICEHLQNPCSNGVCQESSSKDGYECLCNIGYIGDHCQTVKQFCQSEICGDGVCNETYDGYVCDCPIGKIGANCELSQMIRTPKLRHPRSFLAYSAPKSLRRLNVSLSFKPINNHNGILIYSAQNIRGIGDFLALIIYKQRLKFLIDVGTGVTELGSNYTIDSGKWYHVNISKDYKMLTLIVNSEDPIKKSFSDSIHSLNLKTLIYFGGIDRKKISINKNIKVKISFDGCLDKINIQFTKSDMFKLLSDSSNIEECNIIHSNNTNKRKYLLAPPITEHSLRKEFDICLNKPCVHGFCQNMNFNRYSCTCEYGYVGKNCEHILKQCELLNPCLNGGTCTELNGTFKCDCQYGFIGQNCSKSIDILNDVNFRGDGWLELSNSLMIHNNEKEMIGFEISTNETDGLIMWHSNKYIKKNSNDYIALAMIDGYIEFQYNVGLAPVTLRITNSKIDDGQRHRIILKRHGKNGSIELDGEYIEIGASNGYKQQLKITENIFIGGLPDYLITQGKFNVGFVGCIHTLEVQDSGSINIGRNALRGKNVSPCTRAKWIPSSLVFTNIGNMFDAFVPPPPVNIIHPKPTVNEASILFRNSFLYHKWIQDLMKIFLQNKIFLFIIIYYTL